jgi:hypothetical protein
VGDNYGTEIQGIVAATKAVLNFLGDAFIQFPQNISAVIKIGIAEAHNLIRETKIQIAELRLAWNEWTGDDEEAAQLKTQLEQLNAMDDRLDEFKKKYIKGVFEQRDAAIKSFNEQIAAANALGDAKRQAAANDINFDIGQFGVEAANDPTADLPDVKDSELETLRERYASKEEQLLLHLNKQQELIDNSYAQQKISESEFLSLSKAANQEYFDGLQNYQASRNRMLLSASQNTFNSLAGIVEGFGGKQSKAFKVLFAISKGFAIAQSVMNMSTAISNALALPFPSNIPAMAKAAAAGASLIANIRGAQIQGQAHAGLNKNTQEGTWWLRRDEMVLNPEQAINLQRLNEAVANSGTGNAGGGLGRQTVIHSSPVINIDARNAMPGMEQKIRAEVEQALAQYNAELMEDFASGGQRAQMLSGAAA